MPRARHLLASTLVGTALVACGGSSDDAASGPAETVGAGGASAASRAAGNGGAAGKQGAGTAGKSGAAGKGGAGATASVGGQAGAPLAGLAGAGGGEGGAVQAGFGGTAGSPPAGGASGQAGAAGTGPRLAFAAIGDGGKGNAEAKKIGDAVAAKCLASGCDFVQLLGDNIYDDGAESISDSQWQTKFEQPYAAVDLPFWVVLGNHDYGGSGAGYEEKKADVQVAYSQTSKKWKLPARYYHHVEGPAELFALDTNAQMYGKDGQQRDDVAAWLAASASPWKIALGHHPYLSNGKHGDAGNYDGIPAFVPIASGKNVKEFAEDVLCGQVDLYLTGHDHSRQWLKTTCQGTELVVAGAGSGTTELPGKTPAYFQAKTIGFVYVEIYPTTLSITMIDGDGHEEYTRTLTK